MIIFLSKDLKNVVTTTSQKLAQQLLEDDRLMYLGYTHTDSGFSLELKSTPDRVWT